MIFTPCPLLVLVQQRVLSASWHVSAKEMAHHCETEQGREQSAVGLHGGPWEAGVKGMGWSRLHWLS